MSKITIKEKIRQYFDARFPILYFNTFNQNDLMNLLAKGEHTIYLVNNQFEIPLQRKNIKYIGIGLQNYGI